MKYIKKPIIIDAFRYGFDTIPPWLDLDKHVEHEPVQRDFDSGEFNFLPKFLMIQTLKGVMKANIGDYIIKNIKGELYPCEANIFDQTYDRYREGE
jgi:hypothetical protein